MARHFKETPKEAIKEASHKAPKDAHEEAPRDAAKTPREAASKQGGRHVALPAIEDGGMADSTVASPALGFGMERIDLLDDRPPNAPNAAITQPGGSFPSTGKTQGNAADQTQNTLGRNEVAAVSMDRPYYVSDVPSPYLTSKQASEDVRVTRRRHSRITAVITMLLVGAVLGGGGWLVWRSLQTQSQTSVAQYETRQIEQGEYLESIDTTSLVRPASQESVRANVSGKVAEAFVEDGSMVDEGDQLFRLENSTVSDAARRAQEALDSFQQEVNQKQEALNRANEAVAKAQEAVDKNNGTAADGGGDDKDEDDAAKAAAQAAAQTAQAALETAKSQAQLAQSDLDAANANLQTLQETYDRAQEQLGALVVRAPISGEVSDAALPNSTVSSSTLLCTVSDASSLSIVMEIPKSDESRVEVGQEVRLTFPDIEDLQVTSSVASLDSNESTLLATVLIAEPDERLEPGMAADACLVLRSIPNAYIVPNKTLRTAEDGTTHLDVLLDPSRGIVTDVPVTVVATDGSRSAVEAGNIQAGVSVVVVEDGQDD